MRILQSLRPNRSVRLAGALALGLAFVLAQPGLAEDPPAGLEPAFANTIVSTYRNGDQARLWLDRDGGYRGEGRRGNPSSGRWYVKGSRLCMKQARPIPIPFAYCTPIVAGGIGTMWQAKSPLGETIRVELVAGR